MVDKKADSETIALLRKVDMLRAELRKLEPKLNAAVTKYGQRRGYLFGYREFHLRCELEREERNVA